MNKSLHGIEYLLALNEEHSKDYTSAAWARTLHRAQHPTKLWPLSVWMVGCICPSLRKLPLALFSRTEILEEFLIWGRSDFSKLQGAGQTTRLLMVAIA